MTKVSRRSLNKSLLTLGLGSSLSGLVGVHGVFAQAAPVRGGTFTATHTNEPVSLDPMLGTQPGNDARSYNLFSERLIWLGNDGNLEPWLAESWDINADATAVTFKLRSGVTFQDGTPFDAEAVKFNLDRNRTPSDRGRTAPYLSEIDSVEVVDPETVTIYLREPSAAFLSNLTTEAGQIVSPAAVETLGEDFTRAPIGTGPFKLVRWTGGRLEAERYDGYWGRDAAGEALPYLDKVVINVVPQAAVQLVQMRGGSSMWSDNVLPQDVPKLESDPAIELVPTVAKQLMYTSFNCESGPFAGNLELRKAVSHAINREALAKIIVGDYGGPAVCIESPGSWATGPELKGHTYDPDMAREAYAASGHSGPIKVTVVQRDPDGQVAQLVQAMCAQVGIPLEIEVLERQAWGERTATGNFAMTLQLARTPNADPDRTFAQYYARSAVQNYPRFKDDVIFDAVDQARTEVNQEVRRKLYIAAQQQILDQYYQTFHYYLTKYNMRSPKVEGMQIGGPINDYRLDKAWIAS